MRSADVTGKLSETQLKAEGFTGELWMLERRRGFLCEYGYDMVFADRTEFYATRLAADEAAMRAAADAGELERIRGEEDIGSLEVAPCFWRDGHFDHPEEAVMAIDFDRYGISSIWKVGDRSPSTSAELGAMAQGYEIGQESQFELDKGIER